MCTWRYEFIAKKSGVLVFWEIRKIESLIKLGPNKVNERVEYDHLQGSSTRDSSGIEERLSKEGTVPTYNSCTICVGSPGIMNSHTPDCLPGAMA